MTDVRIALPSFLAFVLMAGCFYVTEQERAEQWDRDDDGVERPLDCNDDDASLTADVKWFADADGDGYGDSTAPILACTRPEGFVADDTDCNDADAQTFPDAVERCDGADNDCDRDIDEGQSLLDWYEDADGDGFGSNVVTVRACARPDGFIAVDGDCDDIDPTVHPNAQEVCNGIDDDCDGAVDQADSSVELTAWFEDGDGDGWGADASQTDDCDPPDPKGWVVQGGDCAPLDPAVNPGADELCNGIDDDCDLTTDLNATDATRYYADGDDDGFGDANSPADLCPVPPDSGDTGLPDACLLAPLGYVCGLSDCNDLDPAINPAADELCLTGIDEDCDLLTDEAGCI